LGSLLNNPDNLGTVFFKCFPFCSYWFEHVLENFVETNCSADFRASSSGFGAAGFLSAFCGIFHRFTMKGYRPDVANQKKVYSLRLSLRRLRGEKKSACSGIKSNSEPWIENPRSLAEAVAISDSIERSAQGWRRE